jgi:hypothetical protein
MTARYDSEARSLAIGLAADTSHTSTREPTANVIVGLRDDRPVMIEVIRCDLVGLVGLDVVASEHGLDRAALHAAADAALAASDRPVTVEVGAAA